MLKVIKADYYQTFWSNQIDIVDNDAFMANLYMI